MTDFDRHVDPILAQELGHRLIAIDLFDDAGQNLRLGPYDEGLYDEGLGRE